MSKVINFASILFFLSFAFLTAACGAEQDSALAVEDVFTPVAAGDLEAGQAIPPPEGEVILTVRGDIGSTNVGEALELDIATLEQLDQYEYTVVDPFISEEVTYQGVLMQDLLNLWQVSPDAEQITFTALNDYAIEVDMTEFETYPVLFAFKANGDYMPVVERGPAMLVWPYEHFDLDPNVYNSWWIWQIARIEVE